MTLLNLESLPTGHPFTPAIKLVVGFTFATFLMVGVIMILKLIIYFHMMSVLRDIKETVVVIKEWAKIGKDDKQTTDKLLNVVSTQTENKAKEIKKAVSEVPDKVVEKIKEEESRGDSGKLKVLPPGGEL